MKRIGWAIALAAAGLSPAAAQAPATSVAPANSAELPAGAPVNPTSGPQTTLTSQGPAPSTPATSDDSKTNFTATPAVDMLPSAHIGQPDGFEGIQPQVTEVGREAASFHNNWLLLLCVAICVLVLVLLSYAMIRFRRSANPVPSRTSHNTTIEVVWTLLPVLILVAIAIPSIRLLRHQYTPPPADLTVKVIGNQWYWTYQYPDNGGIELVSNMLKEKADVPAGQRYRTDADGPPLLAADERMVIPAGKVVKFLITSNDVIHSFGVPAFWTKLDANPGQINETWVKVDRPGVYFGQCSELCGARHAFMPIAVEVVPPAQFAAWVAKKGGTMPGAKPAALPAAETDIGTPAAAAPAGGTPSAAEPTTVSPAINQAATAQN
jgi:cytochrome c oxidase subunit 2